MTWFTNRKEQRLQWFFDSEFMIFEVACFHVEIQIFLFSWHHIAIIDIWSLELENIYFYSVQNRFMKLLFSVVFQLSEVILLK